MNKVGAENGRSNSRILEGISGVVFEEGTEVDRNEWKYHDKSQNSYAPKAKSKFKKEWDAIGRVERNEIDIAVGNGAWFSSQCGFAESANKDWYLLDITLEPKFATGEVKPTEDCVEIVSKEYKALRGEEV